ncbi:MAG: CheR family methyltransferase, partial [Myxococcota bacterium]
SAIPAHLLGRYFSRDEAGNYRVRTFLREMMLFSRHDVVREPPFSRLDLIICRNLLIYFRPGTQATVLDRFAFGLAPGALLFLGPSESAPADDWDCSNPRWRIYESRGRTGRFAIPALPALRRSRPAVHRNVAHELGPLHEAITSGRLPPHVITTADLDVVYRSGHMGSLLSLPQGPISTDLRRMVSRNLGTLMSMAVDRVKSGEEKQVVYQDVREPGTMADVHFDLQVQLIEPAGTNSVFLGFFFEGLVTKAPAPTTVAPAISEDVQSRIGLLEDKLRQSERRLQSTVEELESSNEELQATNEELLASNEERQSGNEELQSLNEELHTVNQEHQAKIDQLIVVTSELEQLLQSIDVGVLRLDTELRIQRVNTAFAAYSSVRVEDLGRPLADLRSDLAGVSTLTMCQQALSSNEPISHTGRDGDRTMMLMAQSLSASGKNRGVTLTCTDVTALERAATIEARLVTALNVTALPLAVEDSAGKIAFANAAFARALNREARWLVGSELGDLMLAQDGVAHARRAMAAGHPSWTGSLQVSFGADTSVPVAFSATPCKQGSVMEGIVWRLLTPPEAMSSHSLGFGFVAWDPATLRTWVDPRAAAILGLSLDESVPLSLLIERLDAGTPNNLMNSVRTLTTSGRTSQVAGTTRGSVASFSWIFRVDEQPGLGPIALGVIWQVEE